MPLLGPSSKLYLSGTIPHLNRQFEAVMGYGKLCSDPQLYSIKLSLFTRMRVYMSVPKKDDRIRQNVGKLISANHSSAIDKIK